MAKSVIYIAYWVIIFAITLGVSGKPIQIGPEPESYPVDALLLGKYELLSDPGAEDFKAYLKDMGVNDQYREILSKLKVNVEIFKTGTTYHYRVVTPFIRKEFSFVPEQEVVDTYVDGRKYRSKFEFEGKDSVTQQMIFPNSSSLNKYRFTKDGMTATLKANDKLVERKYKRVHGFTN